MSRRTSSVELWSSSYFKTYFNFLVNMNLLVTEKSAKMCSKAFKQIGKVNILILLAAAFIVIYVEFLHYKIVASRWSKFSKSKNLSVKLVFVSDSQLMGLNDEPWLFGYFTRWDSDRYLAKGFTEALNHVQPDAVVFLGDLFDEGSSSTDIQFESYVRRFKHIFQLPQHVKTVFVPGDNDIAREGFNFIEQKKKERFNKFFPSISKPIVSISFLDILKFEDYDERIDQVRFNMSKILSNSHGKFKIFCNHFGILNYLPKVHKIMKRVQPNLIIAGHEHESAYLSCIDCWSNKRRIFHNRLDKDGASLSLNISQDFDSGVKQIVVPTSNYRMGFPSMGYGFMALDYSGQMNYTVLWLPDRYNMLNIYSWFCHIALVILILQIIFKYSSPFCNFALLFYKKFTIYLLKRNTL